MALALEQFEHQLTPIVKQVAQLLRTRVWAADAHRVIIASSDANEIGCHVRSLTRSLGRDAYVMLAAPLQLARLGAHELYVERLSNEPLSPRLALALIELVASQSAGAAEAPDHHELKNHFVYNLLFDSSIDEEYLIRQGQILGIDLTIPRAAIVIDATDFLLPSRASELTDLDQALMRQRARAVINSVVNFFHLPSATICAYVGNGEIVVLKASSAQDLVAWSDVASERQMDETMPSWAGLPALKRAGAALLTHLRHDTRANICIGIGRYHPGVRGLERSYQDARTALTLGRHFHSSSNQMHCLDSLGIAAFIGIADERTKVDLARKLLGPLDHEPELIETVEAFFLSGCSPSLTASQLCVHRNTLNYRLEKVASLTGLDPRRFDDAVQIRLALLVRSLQP
ncbi:MAG TPA: helix-turn-helix domain-containing protein [Ktedonobacterales bacterium]|nr:helix-turn-helix domain-containing protein [Ktedonobacterales bacterium]